MGHLGRGESEIASEITLMNIILDQKENLFDLSKTNWIWTSVGLFALSQALITRDKLSSSEETLKRIVPVLILLLSYRNCSIAFICSPDRELLINNSWPFSPVRLIPIGSEILIIRFWFAGRISPFFRLSPDSDSNVIIGPSVSLLGEPKERLIPETDPKASSLIPPFILL